jgi:CheY-like chemotaxis protein/anti-sigma regulatory factor (Ser/Thr protein kinase)
LRLIDDILDIAKVEAGKVSVEKAKFSPFEVVTEVTALLRLQAEQKGLQLRTIFASSVPGIAHSDSVRIRQILTNLIGNAIKFTQKGHINVDVRAEVDDQTHRSLLIFEVTDTGIGISEKDQKKLFQPFAQADQSITRQFGGTGLGLVLSQRLAQQLGGDLILSESKVGVGSKFVASINAGPFENLSAQDGCLRDQPANVLPVEPTPTSLQSARVLVVDDVPENQFLLRKYLESVGAEVEVAGDGEEAISKALSRAFDVVLMDIQMPHVDGIQATKRLRAKGYGHPILALTAHAMREEMNRSYEAGCDEHLTKPLSKRNLIAAISKYIHH